MYGVITTVPAPVEMYEEIHRRVGATVDGLLVHVGRATTDGFQTLEVWESKEHYDRANTDIVFPLMRELAGDQPLPSTAPATETFEVRGLTIQRQDHDLADSGESGMRGRPRTHSRVTSATP
jgi:hypothetical protein